MKKEDLQNLFVENMSSELRDKIFSQARSELAELRKVKNSGWFQPVHRRWALGGGVVALALAALTWRRSAFRDEAPEMAESFALMELQEKEVTAADIGFLSEFALNNSEADLWDELDQDLEMLEEVDV